MKTRDRILSESLALFNAEGEADQSAVNIANTLDMSPGNLYYHFKGKDAIIRALFDRFEEEMRIILRGSRGRITSIEDIWVYIYILLEEIYDFRFFYRSLGVLLERYPDLAPRFRALIEDKRAAIADILKSLDAAGLLDVDPRLRPALIDQMLSTLTFWLSKDLVSGKSGSGAGLINKTVFEVLSLIVPHMGAHGVQALDALIEHYESVQDQSE